MAAAAHAPRLVSVGTAVPAHAVAQADLRGMIARIFERGEAGGARFLQVFDHSLIEQRHLCMPLEWYADEHAFAEQNALYVEHALALGASAARSALEEAGESAAQLDHVFFLSSTGLATPSLDARLSLELGCRSDCRRTPVWGLGCAAGAAGLALARDRALAEPGSRVLVVAVELCSLTFRREDLDKRNLVAASLFADGAAAVVVHGSAVPANASARHAPLELLASHSTLWPHTLDIMGWTLSARGMHVVFSRDIPALVRERVRPDLDAFLRAHSLTLADVPHLVPHPGGAKVLAAYADTLGHPRGSFAHAREVLRTHGNMSSPTCLFVLDRLRAENAMSDGEHALIMALGPGFSAEYVLARRASR